MITHTNYDTGSVQSVEFDMPKTIDRMEFSYDGGRVEIYVNGVLVFASFSGSRDCNISMTRD